ncbi:uncharacterized protein B0H18DRAFT_1027077 [Fomitopsis serialis]|uniref:uncharacterized protein n=1 Tax=Fomitopsis serialis TaxID=139415 RepID=UPI00200790BD|nr:uncharacterized protein B0H18DRAFT_1027077 [Neoantrodia serialis]KAH9919602.1 hypothetical protein B0H18DRAFT_1027077 [Neoantrodia serialis]
MARIPLQFSPVHARSDVEEQLRLLLHVLAAARLATMTNSDTICHHIRTIYGNASVPWEDGEGVRIHVLSERENPQVVFKCSEMKEVCQNMCYGITCRELPDTLTKHSAGKEPDDARKRNKCGSKKPNRCSKDFGGTGKGPSGMSCDEYPFATTLEGQQDPSKSVTIQGGTLGVVKKYGDGTAFDVLFDFGAGPVRASSGGGVDYCKAKLHTDSVCQQTDTWQQNS